MLITAELNRKLEHTPLSVEGALFLKAIKQLEARIDTLEREEPSEGRLHEQA